MTRKASNPGDPTLNMLNRYLVVDQNYLRTESIKHVLTTQPEVCLVLPDLAMLEMTKSDNRELTVRLSLEAIANFPTRVFVARAMGESLVYELTRGRSVSGHMLFREATHFIRQMLRAVSENSSNVELMRVLDDPEDHVGDLKRDYLDHTANKIRALELVAETKESMSDAFAKRVRGAKAEDDELLSFVKEHASSQFVSILEDIGYNRQKAISFARTKPMLLRYLYLKVWSCLAWESMGRLESMGAAKVSNDYLDHEYILAATFFDGILSGEEYVNKGYSVVKNLLTARI